MRRKHSRRIQEMMTAYDDNMNDIGKYARSFIHYHGMWHKVVQCWIISADEDGVRVYLQRRSFEKKSHPGRYDITVGGHVAAGEEPLAAVLRETSEEIGLSLNPDRLICLDYVKEAMENDREIAYLYIYVEKDPPFRPGKEVIYMVSADIDDFYRLMTGERQEITVIPAIKTGPMHDEAFTVKMDNCCFHRNFLDVIYPYIKENMKNLSERTAEKTEKTEKSKKTGKTEKEKTKEKRKEE